MQCKGAIKRLSNTSGPTVNVPHCCYYYYYYVTSASKNYYYSVFPAGFFETMAVDLGPSSELHKTHR